MDKKPTQSTNSIWNLLKNSRIVSTLIIVLLVLLILLVGQKVSWLFTPVRQFLSIVGLPIILAGVFYYLLNPLVDKMEHRFHVNRTITITVVFIAVVGLLAWGIWSLIPAVNRQIQSMIAVFPTYVNHFSHEINGLIKQPVFQQFQDQLNHLTDMASKELSQRASQYVKSTVNSVGSVLGTLTTVTVALITMPFILFYLLRDGHKLPKYLVKFVPTKLQKSFGNVLTDINKQISNYVRGQLTVAFFVGVMFWIGYLIIGLKYALTVGIIAGALNLIPYLGSFLGMIPAILIGAFTSPWMLVNVLIVFAIEQTIEGRVLSPLILGSNLKMHPVTIIVVLLAAGKMFGIPGVIFGIPGYAVIKVLVTHLYTWYRGQSDLYQD
ncbi:AI-2E family transporter [Paucilactobacillus sp. N302-9]